MGLTCAGYYVVAIPLAWIAALVTIGFVLEFLRRERTKTQSDDWMNFGKKDDEPIFLPYVPPAFPTSTWMPPDLYIMKGNDDTSS